MNDNIEIYDNPLFPMIRITHRVETTETGIHREYLEVKIENKKLVRIIDEPNTESIEENLYYKQNRLPR